MNALELSIILPALLASVQTRGNKLTRLTTRHASLDDVFVSLTGRHLSDADEEV